MEPIKNIIQDKIKAGEIAMRPRWQFVLKSFLLMIGILILSLSLVYVISFTVFILQYTGALYIPAFGISGFLPFLLAIPWTLLALALLFIVVLEFLVHKFSFAYRKPLLYSIFTIVLISIAGSYIVLQSSIHNRLQSRFEHDDFPIVGSMYRGFGDMTPRHVSIGEVMEITPQEFLLNDLRKGQIKVHTRYVTFSENELIQVGDMVFVFGKQQDGVVEAWGIKIINDDDVMSLPPRMMPPRPLHFE